MSRSSPESSTALHDPSRVEMLSALFAHLVMQQANLALISVGKVPHPETGQPVRDLEAARLFIGLLEMLEAKTEGNLSPEEESLLKQNLTAVRLAFVESVDVAEPKKDAAPAGLDELAALTPQPAASEDEHHPKFTKKY